MQVKMRHHFPTHYVMLIFAEYVKKEILSSMARVNANWCDSFGYQFSNSKYN